MNKEPPKHDHKWTADRPGERPEDDELGRKEFAQQVAKELRGWRQKDSLVVSLNGDWGSGKTTLANLILYYLKEQGATKLEKAAIIVRFNPWQWSGQDKLLEGFFAEVSAAFHGGEIKDKATAKRLARFWEGLRVITVAGGDLATRLQEALIAAVALLAGGSGVVSSFTTNPTGKAVLAWMSFGLLGVATLCAVYAPIAEHLAAVFEWGTRNTPRPLEKVRADLRRELEKLESSLLVVIDDIDRLTKCEMRLLMQLVKANADFPNVVYLLLYQKEILAAALGEEAGEEGHEFLKKIVQVELEVPMVPEHLLGKFFNKQIDPVITSAKVRWEKERWENLFNEGIWPYFRTPRDIKRFKGVLEFYFEAHLNDGVLEVNPIDLIMLETLRMFDPVAYEAVSRAFQKQRNLFLELLCDEKEARDRLNLGISELLAREGLTGRERDRLEVVLFGLFPTARKSFSMSDGQEQDWERHLRICHPKFFRRYFQLGSDPGVITAAFISRLFKSSNDRQRIRELLMEEFNAGRFAALIERLHAVRDDVPLQLIEPLIIALFDLSDALPEVKEGLFSSEAELQLARIALVLLKRIDVGNPRTDTLRRAVLSSTAITGPVICLSMLHSTKEDEAMTWHSLVESSQVQSIEAELLPRLWAAARDGQLWTLRASTRLIHRLRDLAGISEIRAWLAVVLQDPRLALAFLRMMLNESHVSGGRGTRVVYTLLGTHLETFVELDKLHESAEQVAKEVLEKAAVEKLRIAIDLKTDGKPYARIYVLSRDESGRFLSDVSDARL